MIYRLLNREHLERGNCRDVCRDCCYDCSTNCPKQEASEAIASALDFIKYRQNKLDNE